MLVQQVVEEIGGHGVVGFAGQRAIDLADQRNALGGHAEEFLAAQDAGFGETLSLGRDLRVAFLHMDITQQGGGFDDRQQIVDLKGQIVRQVVDPVAAFAVDQ